MRLGSDYHRENEDLIRGRGSQGHVSRARSKGGDNTIQGVTRYPRTEMRGKSYEGVGEKGDRNLEDRYPGLRKGECGRR